MVNRARALAVCVVAFGFVGAPLGGCSSQPETVGSSGARLNTVDTNLGRGSETSVAFGSGTHGEPVIVAGYNTTNTQVGFPDKTAKWATSQNGAANWALFSELANPWVKSNQRPTMNDGSPYHSTASDPAVVWTGWPGIFAYITTATSDLTFGKPGQPSMDVVMAVSKDNGQHFGPATKGNPPLVVLSTHDSSGPAGSNREVDRPVVYAEDSATHVAWVAWANPDAGGCGTQNWIKRLHFLSNGTIDASPVNEIRIDCNLNASGSMRRILLLTATSSISPTTVAGPVAAGPRRCSFLFRA